MSMEKTNEATPNSTPRPWYAQNSYEDNVELITNLDKSVVCRVFYKSDAELIVKAVNAYDSLVAEVQKLKVDKTDLETSVNNLVAMYEEKTAENQKLRELLEKIKDSRELRFAKLRGELYHPLELEIASILTKAKNV